MNVLPCFYYGIENEWSSVRSGVLNPIPKNMHFPSQFTTATCTQEQDDSPRRLIWYRYYKDRRLIVHTWEMCQDEEQKKNTLIWH